jgi:hypothetical protein
MKHHFSARDVPYSLASCSNIRNALQNELKVSLSWAGGAVKDFHVVP